jgi:hypothetical protein
MKKIIAPILEFEKGIIKALEEKGYFVTQEYLRKMNVTKVEKKLGIK